MQKKNNKTKIILMQETEMAEVRSSDIFSNLREKIGPEILLFEYDVSQMICHIASNGDFIVLTTKVDSFKMKDPHLRSPEQKAQMRFSDGTLLSVVIIVVVLG